MEEQAITIDSLENVSKRCKSELEKEICEYLIRILKKDILVNNEMIQLAKLVLK